MDQNSWEVPSWHRVVFENDQVRVLEARIPPKETAHMHGHPPNVAVQLSGGKARIQLEGGPPQTVALRAGGAEWSPGGRHELENLGEQEIRRIIVELKR